MHLKTPPSWRFLGSFGPLLCTMVIGCLAIAPRADEPPPSPSFVPPVQEAPGPPTVIPQGSVPDLFDAVSPAVVYVTAISINPYQVSDRVTHIVGSGMIIDSAGLLLTNAHVVFGRQSIMVTLDDGTRLPAKVVGADPILDLALLRITPPEAERLPTVVLGDSDRLRVGDDVFAIGNPLGLDQTMTRGIVSALNRVLQETVYSMLEPMIQTDTPINPGNSGGPLLNRAGEVVGITTSILPEAQNIGFAIPSNLVKAALPSLLANGRIIRPWLGIQGQLVNSTLRDLLRIPVVDGFLVEVVEPGSPAEKAGLNGGQIDLVVGGQDFLIGGDIVTKMNGTALTSPDNLVTALQGLKVGERVQLSVARSGTNREVDYVLPERPISSEDLPSQRALSLVRGERHHASSVGGASPNLH